MKDLEFILESSVVVDSGQLSICDPCYWQDERLSYDNILKHWDEQALEEDKDPIIELGQLDHVGSNMAVVFPTATGDGIFDVYSVWKDGEIQGMFVSFVKDDFEGASE